MLIENDDENKVFNIAFRTPPKNSTGVAHILEHSVLCGSREFPLKDPFVELVKGSLNTFLNAMTYPDKTCYPVASCNDQDFQNLMHVYLDAVFYPNIYKKEEIFRQEGWSYHLEQPEGPLTYNGVVYNEMKGAFSSPDDVLERDIMNSLFPDITYGCESGGDPDNIPDLSYEEFLDFHRTYYHPSNSYIYLYGNMDMVEKLDFIDKHYLSAYDSLNVDSEIREQKPFAAMQDLTMEYPVAESEGEEDNAYLSYNVVVGTAMDSLTSIAFEVLDYALLSAPGAPLKQALLDVGIGKDIYGAYEDGIRQPYFDIIAKGANADKKDEFVSVIRKVLQDVITSGIDKKALEAGINCMEFRYREADFSSYPKGLIYGLDILGNWLYDDARQSGDTDVLEVSDNYYVAVFHKRYLEDSDTVSVRHILVTPEAGTKAQGDEGYEDEQTQLKAAARAKAEDLLAQWQAGEATEDSFAQLALENSADGSKYDGGLYTRVTKGWAVEEFNDWCFDASRKDGDTGIVDTTYGSHVMYFVGYDLPAWAASVTSDLQEKAASEWSTALSENADVQQSDFGMKFVG